MEGPLHDLEHIPPGFVVAPYPTPSAGEGIVV